MKPKRCIRSGLSSSLGAEAILSLANQITLVGDVCTPLAEFVTAWVTTPSDYDTLFAVTVPDAWARVHRPVLSTGSMVHHLYTGYSVLEPRGEVVRCHTGCGLENRSYNVDRSKVVVKCRECRSHTSYKHVPSGGSTTLAKKNLIKTVYPQQAARVNWKHPASPLPTPVVVTPVEHQTNVGGRPTPVKDMSIGQRQQVPRSTLSRTESASIGQAARPAPTHLAPPPPPISHSISLPDLPSRLDAHQTPRPPTQHTVPVDQPRPTEVTPHVHITAPSEPVSEPRPRLMLRINLSDARLQPPAPQITRSQSTPQMGAQQQPAPRRETLKRQEYGTLDLSTPTPSKKRQRKNR